jgi:hypothetical protein
VTGLTLPEAGRRHVRPALFLRIATDPVTRAWSGVGGYAVAADAVETEGGRYLGVGWLRNIPVMEALLNGAAESVTFTLSGVDGRILDLVDGVQDLRGVRANLGLMFFGGRYQRGPIYWWRRYRVDMVGSREVALPINDGGSAVEASVSLTLGSARTSRRLSQPSTWTHVEQQRLHPGDLGCANVSRLTADATRPWPPKA